MKTNKIKNWIFAGIACILAATSCSVDPSFYSQVVPENFYTSQEAVWERFNRPFTHWRWWIAQDRPRWELQEFGTDEICVPTRGSDWYNGAIYQKFHHHEYSEDMTSIETGWTNFSMGVALAWDAVEDLEGVDFDALGFEEGTRQSIMDQLNTLVASFYLDGLDFFGGVPLYKTTKSDVLPRSTAEETFNFIDSLLEQAIPHLPVKTELGAKETNEIHQAVAAALRVRLYFNAESYIGKPMYDEAAQICQDIIDGKYGKYALATDWTSIFGFRNETCPEILWTVPSENTKLETDGGYWGFTVPYNFKDFLGGLKDSGSDNGCCLLPSRDPQGNLYHFNLSNNYEGFNDMDVRKQQYVYESGGKYRGMFVVGEMINPDHPEWICTGAREYIGKPLLVRDQISYFAKLGTEYATEADLPSNIGTAEENSGARLIKFSPRPNQDEYKEMFNPDIPVIRLAEIYYTLAECKMRNGDLQGAAELINAVRKRYFEGGNDPDPVTVDNLDKYRMLKEWKLEFLGEGRRRTDLVRWNAYVTEDWWDHKATNNPNLNRYPLHYSIIGANNLLEQNPGY